MREVMIRCPETGEQISTGLPVPANALSPARVNAVGCPHCGDLHIWSLADIDQHTPGERRGNGD